MSLANIVTLLLLIGFRQAYLIMEITAFYGD